MNRKRFLQGLIAAGGALAFGARSANIATTAPPIKRPRAIAMWDFSWLERRWPGAGYEEWDRVLDELVSKAEAEAQ